jgi:GNAT superfamily N-acetyltransferase
VLRRATPEDEAAIAEILTAARAAQPWFPQELNLPEENRWFVRELLLPQYEVWVAEEAGRVVAFAGLQDDVLGHLFVHPSAQGHGVGTELLDLAKRERPNGFTLWTHQASEACAFYDARGLVAVELTDGATTRERLPDVRYAWTPGSAAR